MNSKEKIVFSNTLKETAWENSTIISGNIFDKIKKIKDTGSKDMTILGSGSIITQFADHDLLDELTIMVDPVALGNGTPLLNGIKKQLDLELFDSRVFKSGVVLLNYKVIKS